MVKGLQEDASSVQYGQIRRQLARSYEHPYDVPSLVLVSGGALQSTNNVKASFTNTAAPTGVTKTTGLELGAFSDSSNLTIGVTAGATAVQGMRDLYAYAANGDRSWEKSIGRVLFNTPPDYPWLFQSSGSYPAQCNPATCYRVIDVGGKTYWAKTEKDFSDFVLSVLEASSLTRDAISAPAKLPKSGNKRTPVPSSTGIRRSEPTNTAPSILLIPNTPLQ
ncbi:hypothetical protein [Rhizobium leguminosarum]